MPNQTKKEKYTSALVVLIVPLGSFGTAFFSWIMLSDSLNMMNLTFFLLSLGSLLGTIWRYWQVSYLPGLKEYIIFWSLIIIAYGVFQSKSALLTIFGILLLLSSGGRNIDIQYKQRARWHNNPVSEDSSDSKDKSKDSTKNQESRASVGLEDMDDDEFEELVADIWEEKGWNTKVTQSSQDKGIDVIAKKNDLYDQKVLIQAKNYSQGNKVTSSEIQQYASLRQQENNVDEVIIVTKSSFTSSAKYRSDDLNVKLVSGEELDELYEEYIN